MTIDIEEKMNLYENRKSTEKLCRSCGMCCEGIFHARVVLNNVTDIEIAKRLDVTVLNSPHSANKVYNLPCPAFNGECSIYPDRPSTCESHFCLLARNVMESNTPIDTAQERVMEMRSIVEDMLPELQELACDNTIRNPMILMKKVLLRASSEPALKSFKTAKQNTLLKYGVFAALKTKYFYPTDASHEI